MFQTPNLRFVAIAAAMLVPVCIPSSAQAQEQHDPETKVNPEDVDWVSQTISVPDEGGLRFRIGFNGERCSLNLIERERVLFAYSRDAHKNPRLILVPPASWTFGEAELSVLLGSGKRDEDDGKRKLTMSSERLILEHSKSGKAQYVSSEAPWNHVDLYGSYEFTISTYGEGNAEVEGRYPVLDYRFSEDTSRGAAVFFQRCVNWLEARDAAEPKPVPAPEPAPPPQAKLEKEAVFWTESNGDYVVNVRSTGDAACAIDFIDTSKERVVNLLRDAKSGEYKLSLIVADNGPAPIGGVAALNIQTWGKEDMNFESNGSVQSASGGFQTLAGPLSVAQANAILTSDRVAISGNGAQLVEMSVPNMLRAQARLKMLSCHLDRM